MNVSKRIKTCSVNGCLSNSEGFPDKVFITVPQNEYRRRAWFEAVRQPYVCSKTIRFCCEDHFNVPEDFENYMRYKLVGGQILVKKHVVPHKFKWQSSTTLDSTCEIESVEPVTKKKTNLGFCSLVTMDDDDVEIVTEVLDIEPESKVLVKDILGRNGDLIEYLSSHRFTELPLEDQILVRQLPVPRPPLPDMVQSKNGQNRNFSKSLYDRYPWLAGSDNHNKLFCWYCLFYSDALGPFNTTGYDNLKEVHRALAKHESSKDHMHAALKFKLFGKDNIDTTVNNSGSRERDVIRFNETVRENRKIVKNLINMIILASKERPFCEATDEPINLKEIAKFVSTLDSDFNKFIDPSSVYADLSQTIQKDLIDSIAKVVLDHIYEEVSSSSFFSWQIDQITHVDNPQISVISRFVRNGKPVERFLGYFDSNGQNASDITRALFKKFVDFDIKRKLIGQAYDGAVINPSDLIYQLQENVKCVAPQALFLHSYAHELSAVLQDSCKTIRECRVFFSNLAGFSLFFARSVKHKDLLHRIYRIELSNEVPDLQSIEWNFQSRAVRTVFENKSILMLVFDGIIENCDEWDDATIREAINLKNLLTNGDFTFLLSTFNLIFSQIDPILPLIERGLSDMKTCCLKLKLLLAVLKNLRSESKFYEDVCTQVNDSSEEPMAKRVRNENCEQNSFKKTLFYAVINLIINQIKIRFHDFACLAFVDLVSPKVFHINNEAFPEKRFHFLRENYKNIFTFDRLRKELQILYSDKTIFGESSDIQDMIDFIYKNDIIAEVPELYKFLCLLTTLPCSSAFEKRPPSTLLKRIKSMNSDTRVQRRLNNLSVLTIEQDLVETLKKNFSFYDEIINHLASTKPCHLDLLFVV